MVALVHGMLGLVLPRAVMEESSLAVVSAMTQCQTQMVCLVKAQTMKHETAT